MLQRAIDVTAITGDPVIVWKDEVTYDRLESASIEEALSSIFPQYAGYQIVVMPPTWKEKNPSIFTFVLFSEELDRNELVRFFDIASRIGIPNPRPISARLLEFASLFHPQFYASFTSGRGSLFTSMRLHSFLRQIGGCCLVQLPESALPAVSVRYYMQSLLFLAGCTLSAAIVQNRYSEGTIDSKLNRLWQAAQYARRFRISALVELKLDEFVIDCAKNHNVSPHLRLINIKKQFSEALRVLSEGLSVKCSVVSCDGLSSEEKSRFGFISELQRILGSNLQSIFVYGSAVTSRNFSDYDLLIVVKNIETALRTLAGTHPCYKGKEINMNIYDTEKFAIFQLMSGDNLNHNARCVYGEAELVIKPAIDLMIRNFSFGFIRLRQLLGMAAFLAKNGTHSGLKDKKNLYEYFIKIPMHIMKGVLSVAGEPVAKEIINAWTAKELQYDILEQMSLVEKGAYKEAIANSYLATFGVIEHLNARYKVFETVPGNEVEIWDKLKGSKENGHMYHMCKAS